MKRMFFAGLLLIAFSTVLISGDLVSSGKSNTALGDYRIELASQPVTINGEQLKAYTISYENSPLKVTVAVKNEKKCRNFIVLSDKLSIQYVCNGDYFGVQMLSADLKVDNAGFATSDAALNRTEYFHQKLIAHGKQSEITGTEYIAAYFPLLIKDEMTSSK